MEMNSTKCCYYSSVSEDCPWEECEKEYVDEFIKKVTGQMWRVDALLLVNVILAGVIVGIGAYGNRYRHYGFTRYLFLGASTLFLPIISYVLSTVGSDYGTFSVRTGLLEAICNKHFLHPYLVIVSTGLILISAINTSPVVATDDRENRSIRPPFELLVQGIWIAYLAATVPLSPYHVPATAHLHYFIFIPFALIHAKVALNYYAFLKARKSSALGNNPRLIIGYMQQLREGSDQHGESMTADEEGVNEPPPPPPPLIVMGEDDRQVEKQPNGYIFRNNLEVVQGAGLVTIDRVWQLDNVLLTSMPQLKDLCLSFALFKLLRCRFARYKLTDDVISTKTVKFVTSVLLKHGEHERAFGMIADELSFLHDYYDSPLPISYSVYQLTIFSMLISVLSIGYCILSGMDVIRMAYFMTEEEGGYVNLPSSISCIYTCDDGQFLRNSTRTQHFGSSHYDLGPVLLLFLLVVVAEARNIASHICSSWTKVILTCRCVHRVSLGLSPVVPKWVGFLLQCRCSRLMRHWNDKMRQNSLLVLQPRQFHQLVFPQSILNLLEPRKNNVKIPSAVKDCIIATLRRSTGRSNEAGLSKGMTSLRQSQVGESLLWACNSKGTTDTILVWHIATAVLEVRHPHQQQDGRPSSTSDDKKTAATHLSRYCAYLVAFYPELLPDDDGWSKGLYKLVEKDVERALAPGGGTGVSSMPPEEGYRQLIELLGARQNHQVLKDAAKLAEQLGELATGEMVWKLLAGFWSEMVLYLAPSDNLKGHMEAVDRGGELITLLWALLTTSGLSTGRNPSLQQVLHPASTSV